MEQKLKDDFRKDIKKLCEQYGIRPEDAIQLIKQDESSKYEQQLRKDVTSNKEYVGKAYRKLVKPYHGMFPSMYRYFKVISERSDRVGSVSCLVFDQYPHYWFEYQAHMMPMRGDYYLGEFIFTPVWTDVIPVTELLNKADMVETDDFTFSLELERLAGRISSIEWTPDHYRMGGKLPGDVGWAVEPDEDKD